MHTTNYRNTFIEIAEDSKITKGEMPPLKGEKKTVANLQFDMLYDSPYHYTSDEVLFSCLLYTSPSPRDKRQSRMPSSA